MPFLPRLKSGVSWHEFMKPITSGISATRWSRVCGLTSR